MPLATYLRGWSGLVHSLYVWLARGGTRVQPHRTFWGRSITHCLYGQQYIPDWRDPHITICYTLNFDLVTDAASRGFPVLAPFDPPILQPHSRTKHEVDRTNPRGDMAIRNFPIMGQMRSLSVGRRWVGRSSLYMYTSSYTDLFAVLGT